MFLNPRAVVGNRTTVTSLGKQRIVQPVVCPFLQIILVPTCCVVASRVHNPNADSSYSRTSFNPYTFRSAFGETEDFGRDFTETKAFASRRLLNSSLFSLYSITQNPDEVTVNAISSRQSDRTKASCRRTGQM